MVKDIVPELLETIEAEYKEKLKGSKKASELRKKADNGKASYADAHMFAVEAASILSASFSNNLDRGVLPDGVLYYNIASRLIPHMLKIAYEEICEYTAKVQTGINKKWE